MLTAYLIAALLSLYALSGFYKTTGCCLECGGRQRHRRGCKRDRP